MAVVKQVYGTIFPILSTELNSMANNVSVLSNVTSLTEVGYLECDIEIVCTFGTAPTSGSGFSVWFIRAIDGINYEDGDASTVPSRAPDLVIPVRSVNTIQRIVVCGYVPPGNFKVLIRNDRTGQAIASSGNTLKLIPRTYVIE